MRNYVRVLAVAGLALWAAPASAKTVNTEFKTDLDPCCAAPADDNGGSAEYKKQVANGTTTKQERFRAQARIELPSAALGLATVADAEAADVRVILTRASVDYAECSLVMVDTDQETELEDGELVVKTEAEFLVDVRNILRKGSLLPRNLVGACDTDLATPGIQDGVPVVQAGDVATVTLVDPTEAAVDTASRTLDKDFLQGTF
ncbi:MAG TPA: hypothetical protein VI231_15535 [Candidatus Binatia bacterium]|jgi:hypothetical protein